MSISAQSISLQWSDGSIAFKNINFTLSPGLHALVGRNGSGKSTLAQVLAGALPEPDALLSSGSVHRSGSVRYVAQTEQIEDISIAEFLNAQPILTALERIAQGSSEQADFDAVGDNWTFADDLQQQLSTLGVWDSEHGFNKKAGDLSGGESGRLRLFKAFVENPMHLILDEPSNHLDTEGRAWLLQQCLNFVAQSGHCLLVVSHDRELMQYANSVSELNSLGLQSYSGNYNDYIELAELQIGAAERQLKHAIKQTKTLEKQIRKTLEKAEKRQRRGQAARAKGSQAKVILDFAKENAQKTSQALSTQTSRQQAQTGERVRNGKSRLAAMQNVQLSFANASVVKRKRLLLCEALVLPYGNSKPLNMSLNPGDKVHLTGANGMGKSTFLQVLTKKLTPEAGHLLINCHAHLLDQKFSLIDTNREVLENLSSYVPQKNITELRTALAQAGLYEDAINRSAKHLSGGEAMKLAMLMVTMQEEPELLLLDEPDNHLDIQSKQQLAQAIRAYQGALLVVSHDKHFVEDAEVTQTFELT